MSCTENLVSIVLNPGLFACEVWGSGPTVISFRLNLSTGLLVPIDSVCLSGSIGGTMPLGDFACHFAHDQCPSHTIETTIVVQFIVLVSNVTNMEGSSGYFVCVHTHSKCSMCTPGCTLKC